MKTQTKKIVTLSLIAFGIAVISIIVYLVSLVQDRAKSYPQENALAIPPLIDGRDEGNNNIELVIQDSEHEFFSGIKSKTKSFGQSYLGPTIRLYQNASTQINFTNTMDEPTTVHGHGLHVEGKVDGGPHSRIFPGETKSVILPIVQEAGTSWYHPHFMASTAEHVHAGLAGMYVIEDANSQTLPLPKNYGINDIPLIVQDRTFIDGKMQGYAVVNSEILDGLRNETLVVNGTINPHHVAPKGWVRLRLLNGSNARFFRFFFTDNVPFYKIATEGGFLNHPVAITELTMGPGERNEIMIDLSSYTSLSLMAKFLAVDQAVPNNEEGLEAVLEYIAASFISLISPVQRVVELRTDAALPVQGELPEKLNEIDYYTQDDSQSAVKRIFTLNMDLAEEAGPINEDNQFSINNKPMNMNVFNERVKKGDLELWTVTAELMPHSFHIHGVSFQILTLNGQPPAEEDNGWKDTVIVNQEPTVLLMRFEHEATEDFPYMYHCHILEHEDSGMMGQFTVY